MEALAAVSLACNVVQLLQFTSHTVHVCKQLAQNKAVTTNIDDYCKELHELTNGVMKLMPANGQPLASSGSGNGTDQRLLTIANKLVKIADDLEKECAKYQPIAKNSKHRILIKTIKYQWGGKARIEELYAAVKALENTMQSFVLADLRETISSLGANDLKSLDQRTRDFASQLQAGLTGIDDLVKNESADTRGVVIDEHRETRSRFHSDLTEAKLNITTASKQATDLLNHRLVELRSEQTEQKAQESVSTLLASIAFPDMNARYNSISPSHQSTFDWLFDPLDDSMRPSRYPGYDQYTERVRSSRQAFVNWLSSEEKLFWINGKPGSGKSTLMRFLERHPRIHALLPGHNGTTLIVSHFLWNAGSYPQRSQRGLAASLLHQILSHRADVRRMLLQEGALQSKVSHSDWSSEELESYLLNALKLVQSQVFIFVDGLDEIDHDQGDGLYNLLGLVHQLELLPNIRMCISSRPETLIVARLQDVPTLRLQDLTNDDIRAYILDTLNSEWRTASFLHPAQTDLDHFTELILSKAEGVFLWVRLAVSSIRNGLIKYDTWEMLLERIDALPSQLHELYAKIWARLNDDNAIYRSRSAYYFKVILHWNIESTRDFERLNLINMLLACDPSLRRSHLEGGDEMTKDHLVKQCGIFRTQLLSRCAGLVEVHEIENNSEKPYMPSECYSYVDFILKSATDFLLNTLDGQDILRNDDTSQYQLQVQIALGYLSAKMLLLRAHRANFICCIDDVANFAPSKYLRDQDLLLFLDLTQATVQRLPEWNLSGFDFACVLSYLGMEDHVKRLVSERPPPCGLMSTDWKNLLLAHACSYVLGHGLGTRPESRTDLIKWLLDNGADPNGEVLHVGLCGRTPFACFSRTVHL
ncbi:hypothetical protein K491DRAFT_64437 [Lophiostoma macrostomum CBS 122681]|uniref:NACHT domain-containing protein n=1 Tax=Lophiostoma macrostomum CBS 122681 TaxID=1314788 RepID=A0A6A6SWX5_9PLEO|nr:hypothetical protein K491DRAFT_64437 [Lophiostoma macrostomum CBS 122681]